MIRGWGWSVIVGVVVVGSAACSSSNHDDDDFDDPGASPDAGPSSTSGGDFITEYCTALSTCCGAMALSSDVTRCRKGLDYGDGAHDTASENACLAAIQKAAASNPSWCAQQSRDDEEVCALAVFALHEGEPTRGKLGDGCVGSLTLAIDHSSEPQAKGTVCYETDGLACRIIGTDPPKCVALATVGQPCDDNATEPKNCVYDAYCDATSHTCKPYAELGQSCAGATCNDAFACTSGTCGSKSPPGTTCNDNGDCASGSCRLQDADASVQQCDPGLDLWGIGGAFCQATPGGS